MKVLGILIGAFLLMGFVFIEPARNWDGGLRNLWALFGAIVCITLAWYGIRRVVREGRVRHER